MRALYALSLALGAFMVPAMSHAETLSGALSRAYLANPMLNRDRAATRVADENVSKANAGYRPRIVGTPFLGYDTENVISGRTKAGVAIAGDLPRNGTEFPKDFTVTATQTVFNGNRTTNGVRQAESQVFSSREALRETEQETLLAGATAYMDVLQAVALEALARNEIRVLIFELRGARARFRANEVTFTDVAQVATSLARVRTGYHRSVASLSTSIAAYRRVIGTLPTRLEAARPIDAIAPATSEGAIALALREHPSIAQAQHNVDAAEIAVRLREGALYPTLSVVGEGQASVERGQPQNQRTILQTEGSLAIPLYMGGQTYALIRQAKEQLTVARFKVDSAREQVRATVASNWAQLEAAKELIYSAKAATQAAEVALIDVRAEASMGQRTTYDVLLAIQSLFSARVTLITAQRDRVVASYQLAAAIGRLDATDLGLAVVTYDPTIHYDQVKDKWVGLRTPDGR